MTYRALRAIRGDYGMIHPGATFEAPPSRRLDQLEARGIIERVVPGRIKRITVYENKAVTETRQKKHA